MAIKKAPSATTLEIQPLKQGRVKLRMMGTTPLYFNSMSSKAMRDLLVGAGKKTAAQKKEIKHNPEQEFRESVYKKQHGETLLSCTWSKRCNDNSSIRDRRYYQV